MSRAARYGGGANKGSAGNDNDAHHSARPARSQAPQPVGDIIESIVLDVRRQRHANHLHRLGPRPVLEALKEVAAGHSLDSVLDSYARLDLRVVAALDADRFPPGIFAVAST